MNSRLGFVYRTTIPRGPDIELRGEVSILRRLDNWRKHLGLRLIDNKMRNLVDEDHGADKSCSKSNWWGVHPGPVLPPFFRSS